MFYTSFLIKEGKAKIFFKEMDENDKHLPYIIPVKKRKQNEGASIRLDDKHQLLMSISVEEWIRLKVLLIIVPISRIGNFSMTQSISLVHKVYHLPEWLNHRLLNALTDSVE